MTAGTFTTTLGNAVWSTYRVWSSPGAAPNTSLAGAMEVYPASGVSLPEWSAASPLQPGAAASPAYPLVGQDRNDGTEGVCSISAVYVDISAAAAAWATATYGPNARVISMGDATFTATLIGYYGYTYLDNLNTLMPRPDVVFWASTGPTDNLDNYFDPAYGSPPTPTPGPNVIGIKPGGVFSLAASTELGRLAMPQSGHSNFPSGPLLTTPYPVTVPGAWLTAPFLLGMADAAVYAGGFSCGAGVGNGQFHLVFDQTAALSIPVEVMTLAPPMFAVQRSGGLDSHAYRAVQRTTRQSSLLQSGML